MYVCLKCGIIYICTIGEYLTHLHFTSCGGW